jgi:hypothetical protein
VKPPDTGTALQTLPLSGIGSEAGSRWPEHPHATIENLLEALFFFAVCAKAIG